MDAPGDASYDTASHWTGPVKVLGFSHANADSDGRAVTEAYLTYLARHPKTAERIARKLAVRFVSDAPSDRLVAHLAQVYLDNDTAIKPVLRALVASPEFRASAGLKVRTPTDDVVATHRVLGTQIAGPVDDDSSAANSILWQAARIGQSPVRVEPPRRAAAGQPVVVVGVAGAGLLRRALLDGRTVVAQAGRHLPHPSRWLPTPGMRFDALVDHLCEQMLGKPRAGPPRAGVLRGHRRRGRRRPSPPPTRSCAGRCRCS